MNTSVDVTPTIGIDRVKAALDWRSDATVYQYIASRGFPRPIKGSRKCARWLVSEVNAWIADRAKERDKAAT